MIFARCYMVHLYLITFADMQAPIQLQERKKKAGNSAPFPEMWYDVQDQNGIWRIGFCERKENTYRVISLDGFHPSYTSFYCEHMGKVLPVRSKTMGLTVPEEKTIRGVVKVNEIEQTCGKMSLFLLMSNQLDNTPEKIRVFIRTQLLLFIDKVFNTPFEILQIVKTIDGRNHKQFIDVHINKLFMVTIEYYFKLLESSKRFVSLLDSNETANELYKATYEMALSMSLILGVHKRSKAFYESPNNRTIKCQGILDYFIRYEGGGILPFKLFFKNVSSLKNVQKQDLVIVLETVYLFISICEKYQSDLVQGKIQSLSRIILDEIINMIKVFCQKKKQIAVEIKGKIELISRIQTLYFKLYPNQQCNLRKFIEGQKEKDKDFLKQLKQVKSIARMKSEFNLNVGRSINKTEKQKQKQKVAVDNEKVKELEEKIGRLELALQKMQVVNIHQQQVIVEKKDQPLPAQPTQNLGEQAFLSSLQWALDAGDLATCKKLVQWRKSLLKLGRITGWQIALAVGIKTFKSKEIHPEDIIEANYDYIVKVSPPPK